MDANHAVCQGRQARLAIQADLEDPENQVQMACQEIQENLRFNHASPLLRRPVSRVRADHLAHLDHPDQLAMQDNQANPVNQDKTAHQASPDQKDHQDRQDNQDNQGAQENQEHQPNLHHQHLALQDLLETKAHQDHQDHQGNQAQTAAQAPQDQRDLLDHQDHQEMMANLDLQDKPVLQEMQARRVFARNTALWTEVSSSKMELVAVKSTMQGRRFVEALIAFLFLFQTSMQKTFFNGSGQLE